MTPTKAAFSETIAVLVEKKAVLVGTKGVFVEARKDLNFVQTDTNSTHSLSLLEKAKFFVSHSKFPPNIRTLARILCLNIDAMTPPSKFASLVAKIQVSSPSKKSAQISSKTSNSLYFAKNLNIKFIKIFRNYLDVNFYGFSLVKSCLCHHLFAVIWAKKTRLCVLFK